MKKIAFYKKKKIYIISLILLAGTVGLYAYFTKEEVITYDYLLAQRGELIQEVSVTGKVEAAASVNLAFAIGGKVDEIFVHVSDAVKPGDKLVSLVSDDLKAQLNQAWASVSGAQATFQQYLAAVKAEEAKLDELKKGVRQEEIKISETAVLNARKDVADAETNLANTKAKAEVDLEKVYQDALNALPTAVNAGKKALLTFTDIQYSHFSGYKTEDIKIATAKGEAIHMLFDVPNAGRYSSISVSTVTGGIYTEAQNLFLGATHETTDQTSISVIDALQKVKNALDAVPVSEKLTVTEKSNLDIEKTAISSEITTLSSKQQAISVQKAANQSAIFSAEASVNAFKNALDTAQNALQLKIAGSTKEQINAQAARVDQAKAMLNSQRASINQAYANVQYYQAQIEKTIIRSPIAGVVTKMEAKPGEIVLPSSTTFEIQVPLVSVISEGDFEIKVSIPEVDINKVKVGDVARVTLDAYSSDDVFSAVVAAIDPAETVIDGLSTYKTTLLFTEVDDRIKSGMTTNVDIITAQKDDVVIIPQRAVITKEGKKIVRILKDKPDPKNPKKTIEELIEVEVVTGLRGSAGEIEITEGVNEGDKVVTAIINGQK